MIRTSEDEHVVALQRIDEIEESDVIEGEESSQAETSPEHNPEQSAQQDADETSASDEPE